MTSRTPATGTHTTSSIFSASDANDPAAGWLERVSVTSDQGSLTSSAVDLTSLTVTFTPSASRVYEITGFARFSTTVSQDDARLAIVHNGVGDLQDGCVYMSRNTATSIYSIHLYWCGTFSAVSTTIKLQGGRQAGTGTVTMQASSEHPAFLVIKDVGST